MTTPRDLFRPQWRKSSRSSGNGQCVEVADVRSGVAVRDSKQPGPTLTFAGTQWNTLMGEIKAGAHDLT